ncbi:STAS-like domain-containing protein [Hymenobacter baengnokdamensis]|uniref:STAS-like domain-containing protein n=1 Tax=Hymenobacter baengnokdamensis TaxID=2615203 RepID=UPI0012479E9C|nr:DUF4325 domain-containing protein [Hymenobacter baengnokdamensis]
MLASTPLLELTALVQGTFTNAEGAKLFAALAPAVAAGQVVRLSLHHATPMSTSFLNSSFGALIDQYGLPAVQHSLRLTNYLPSHASCIKNYLDTYLLP